MKVRYVHDLGSVVVAEVVLIARNDGPLDLGGEQIPTTGMRVEVPMV